MSSMCVMSSLTSDDINIVLQNKLKSDKFDIVSCTIQDSSGLPIGFLSAIEKVCLKYMAGGQEEELHLFIKKMPASPYHRNIIRSVGAFKKEVILFDKFLNELRSKFEGNPFPTCYLGRVDEIVVLKDLSREGFSNVPRYETFSVDHCMKALESLAKLHAASLAFEVKQGCKINEYIKVLQEETIFKDDDNEATRKADLVDLKALRMIKIKYLPKYDEELTEKVFKYLESIHEAMKPSSKYPNVLSHSDLWANNIMFRYNEGKVVEACIIDFQMAAYRPLAYDVLMLLYMCTDKQLRDKHLKYLLEHYYISLSKEMESEELNLSKLLPRTEFDEMFHDLQPALLGIAPQNMHFVLMPDKIINHVSLSEDKLRTYFEVDRSEYALKAAEECLSYRNRVVGALKELFEYFQGNSAL